MLLYQGNQDTGVARRAARLAGRFAGAEGVEGPAILALVVAKDVMIAVVGADAEIDGVRFVPLILHFDHCETVASYLKASGALVGAMAGVAFDLGRDHGTIVRRSQWKIEMAAETAAGQPRAPATARSRLRAGSSPRSSGVRETALKAAPTITTSATKYIQIIKPITAAMLP